MGEQILTTDEMINKSLDEIESLAGSFEETLAKAQQDEDLPPEGNEGAEGAEENTDPEAGNPEEDTDGTSGDTDEDTEGEENEGEDEDVEKSLESTMRANDNISKALEVSEFLNELVKSISTVLGSHQEELAKSQSASEHSNQLLAKSLLGITKAHQTMMKSQSELHRSVAEISKQLEVLQRQPVMRKSVASNAQPIEKSFNASVGNATQASQQPTQALSKSQASQKLMQAYDGGNTEMMSDILALEGTGSFDSLSAGAKNILGL